MFLSASIISRGANWELEIGVTCWHQQSGICQRGTVLLVLLQSQPCKVQGLAQDSWIIPESAQKPLEEVLQTDRRVCRRKSTTASQVLPISRESQPALQVLFTS